MKGLLAVMFSLGLAVMGCGNSAKDVCNSACTKLGNCMSPPWTSVEVATCQAQLDCSHADDNPGHCKNNDSITNCQNDCLGRDCNTYVACTQGCPQCQQ